MKNYISTFFVITSFAICKNNYPIVFIHGFLGWGPNEMGNYNYWGGDSDICGLLRNEGYQVFEVSVGPISSNWDRAIEVFYQLKGGQVDYGKGHSEKYDIIQKPEIKFYEGLYPEWDENNPIHLIGHSMGGQTARVLNYMLNNIIYVDSLKRGKEKSKLLGEINKNWICSISTISTPHDGITLGDHLNKNFSFIQYFIGLAGVIGTDFYNFDLEQWGFSRKEDESWGQYVERIRDNKIWDSKNISSWDLSLLGARQINSYARGDKNVYYFSVSTSVTEKNKKNDWHTPQEGSPLLIQARARIIGKRVGYWEDGSETDSTWYENDGLVNTISMSGPKTGEKGSDQIIRFNKDISQFLPGQWYSIGPLRMDHWNIIGHKMQLKETSENSINFFKEHALRLMNLTKK